MIKSSEEATVVGQSTPGTVKNAELLAKHIYTEDEIDRFRMDIAINNHPLARKPTIMRSKLAYKEILKNTKPTKKYLLPGQICIFHYLEPKYKEELEYYDRTPLVLFFGITRTKEGNIREIGINLHYYPPFARGKILNTVYEVFKSYFTKNFNEPSKKPNMFISYKALKHLLKHHTKLAFGIKMYIPVLRQETYMIPTRLLGTAYYTEGNFSKATLAQVRKFWRQFRP
ncbi:MAG: hypothetical protein J6D03_01210 [Clostridia bacterium]|nr:hypothetical protein [Clostridia bacterium]